MFLRSIGVHSDNFRTTPESYAILQERIRSIIIRIFEHVPLRRDYVPGHRSTGWIHDMSYSQQTVVNINHAVRLLPIPYQKG